ncbi:MAG: ROK family protein [Gemmataceae bacterium]
MFLGIEIGGTKLQLGVGRGDGHIVKLWRGKVDALAGGEGIRRQILTAVPELLAPAGLDKSTLRGIGVGFGGPTDDATQSVIKSHHIAGWDNFPLAAWLTELLGLPTVICNDADVAGLAEALHGAGQGLSPIFYITVGTGVGGGLIINGDIYRGVGRGAAEIGHVRPVYPKLNEPHFGILEEFASGTGIGQRGSEAAGRAMTGEEVGRAADATSRRVLDEACQALAENICTIIKLLCPRRVIIGGGVSLIGEVLFFEPIRRYVAERGMQALAGLTDIVPAALGEEVVVHGALALARRKFDGK